MFRIIFSLLLVVTFNNSILFSQNIIDTLFFQSSFDFRVKKIVILDLKNDSFSTITRKDGRNLYPVGFTIRDNTEKFKIEVYYLFNKKESKVFNIKDVKTKYIHIDRENGELQLKYRAKIRGKV